MSILPRVSTAACSNVARRGLITALALKRAAPWAMNRAAIRPASLQAGLHHEPGFHSDRPWASVLAMTVLVGGATVVTYAGYTVWDQISNVRGLRGVPYSEIAKHNTRDSCWIVVNGQVYDATSALRWHPAGADVILQNSGKDATKAFNAVHKAALLKHLPPHAHLGPAAPNYQQNSDVEDMVERSHQIMELMMMI